MVQAGESIENLTNAFKVTEADILEQNPDVKDGLKEGSIILIPVKDNIIDSSLPEITIITYKVKPGDTLYSLAKNNNTTIVDIIQRNAAELGDGVLRAGSVIKIAKNSGGLTGGEDAKREREKQKKERENQIKFSKRDSMAKVCMAYWSQPWTIIDVKVPGTIDTLRNEQEWRLIKRLKVIGTINQADLSVVGKRIFEFDNINALDLHDVVGMRKISFKDFEECVSLKAISLPNSTDSIGIDAFAGSGNLEVLRCYALTPPKSEKRSFNNVSEECIIEVPNAAIDAYKKDNIWGRFKTIKAIPTISNQNTTPQDTTQQQNNKEKAQ